ncbi:MAG: rRNA pseudouridine synthase [Candidatus Omnitrophica bacterium]|nr:rRNA pseudouridine synthase [Candidatus Omnitrophota bacterium]
MNKIRLQVALAKIGIASRRKSALIIQSNRIRVNGKPVNQKGFHVDISKDKITLDGKVLFKERGKHYYVLNKPTGIVSTSSDERQRPSVVDYVRNLGVRLYPVGRLDQNTTGLIILTNDGDLTYRLTHPKFGIERVYEVKVKGAMRDKDMQRLKSGIVVEGKTTQVEKIVFKKKRGANTRLLITLSEGRKREVREIFNAIGYPVLKLKRVAYGPLVLGGLKEGMFRPLAKFEVIRLKRCVGLHETR